MYTSIYLLSELRAHLPIELLNYLNIYLLVCIYQFIYQLVFLFASLSTCLTACLCLSSWLSNKSFGRLPNILQGCHVFQPFQLPHFLMNAMPKILNRGWSKPWYPELLFPVPHDTRTVLPTPGMFTKPPWQDVDGMIVDHDWLPTVDNHF